MISVGILSWGAPKTLQNTLDSYEYWGLFHYVDEVIVFFQEISHLDIATTETFNIDFLGESTNIGIAAAYKKLVLHSTGDLFLFLENDWELQRNPRNQIQEAARMLENETIDVARFRDRRNPGSPLWTRQFEGKELSRPEHLLDSIHWTDPDKFEQIEKVGKWYITSSKYANWTNNPTMFRKDWLVKNILENVQGDIERSLQDWWQQQDFVVAQSEGLFVHKRLDH